MTVVTVVAVLPLSTGAQAAPPEWDPRWVASTDGGSTDTPAASALNPSNGSLVVTGLSYGAALSTDIATVSYSSTGHTEGGQTHTNPTVRDGEDYGVDVAVGQNGYTYVTGGSEGDESISAAVTVAYDRSGTQLWADRYVAPDGERAFGSHVAVDNSRNAVYVAVREGSGAPGIVLLAYSVTGQRLWTARYDARHGGADNVHDIAVDPGTGQIYLGGSSDGGATDVDYVTLAYSAAGEQLWVDRYNGPSNGFDYATQIDVARGQVYVAGWSDGGATANDYVLVAYNRAGRELWVARYHGGGVNYETDPRLAVDHRTGTAYVTGTSQAGAKSPGNYATVAYARDGSQLWAADYDSGGEEFAQSIVVDPRRDIVYITGSGEGTPDAGDYGYRTVAYSVGGDLLREDFYSVPDSAGSDYVSDLAVDPRNGQVYVTGAGAARGEWPDYTTVAYPPAG